MTGQTIKIIVPGHDEMLRITVDTSDAIHWDDLRMMAELGPTIGHVWERPADGLKPTDSMIEQGDPATA